MSKRSDGQRLRQVVPLLARGLGPIEIARRLGMSAHYAEVLIAEASETRSTGRILVLLAQGHSAPEVARLTGRSVHTVRRIARDERQRGAAA